MTKEVIKTVGEGGAHSHGLFGSKQTDKDGKHKHIFLVEDRIMMTDFSGEHSHMIDTESGKVGPESIPHIHGVTIKTTDGPIKFITSSAESHSHELQVNRTTLSGVHKHFLDLNGNIFISLVPGDLIEELEVCCENEPSMKSFKVKKNNDYPMEMDFSLIKKLNTSKFKSILRTAVERSLIKRMAKLGEGLRIESLILSRERFTDIGQTTIFILDQGLDIKSSQVLLNEGVFTFQVMSRDGFEETTLQRIRITEGVEAVVGFLAERNEEKNDNVIASGTIDELTDVIQSKDDEDMGKETSLAEKFKVTMGNFDMEEKVSPVGSSLDDFLEEEGIKIDKSKTIKSSKKVEKNGDFKLAYEIISKNEDQRLITGPVLIPDNIDLQDDIINKEEIMKAAFGYMIKLAFRDDPDFLTELGFRNNKSERGFQHVEFTRKMAVVETFLAPVDFEMNGRMIIKGTWVMTMKVFDDEVWSLVKTGKITGFSIGGRSKSRPVKNTEE